MGLPEMNGGFLEERYNISLENTNFAEISIITK